MIYSLTFSDFFMEQLSKLSQKDKGIIEKKVEMIKLNPFRFKAIHSKRFSRVFRIRLNIEEKETRLVYVVIAPKIIIACLLLRKDDYKDLEKYLAQIKV